MAENGTLPAWSSFRKLSFTFRDAPDCAVLPSPVVARAQTWTMFSAYEGPRVERAGSFELEEAAMARLISVGSALLVMAGLVGWAMTEQTASSAAGRAAKAANPIMPREMMDAAPASLPVEPYSGR